MWKPSVLTRNYRGLLTLCFTFMCKLQREHILLAEKLCLVTQSNFLFYTCYKSFKAQSMHHIFPLLLGYAIYYLSSYFMDIHSFSNFPEFQRILVHSCQQKSIGLKFSNSQTGSDVRYSCHHNSSRFTFPVFAHSCRFSVLHSLQSITPYIY